MKIAIVILALCAASAFAQAPPQPPNEPQLSTAEKTALQTLENQKQQAQQAEFMIDREFRAAHPGYYINLQNFSVEKIPVPPAAKKP